MGLTHWGDVPIYSGLYYNNGRPIAAALSRLVKREHQTDILMIASEMPSVTDGALMHLTSMLSEMRGSGIEVLWYTAYPESTFRDFGLALRRFLLDLWKRNDIRVIGEQEFVALSFEIPGCFSAEEYFERNIRALGTRSSEQEILVIIDLQAVPSKVRQAEFLELGQRLLCSPSKAWRGSIAIVSDDAAAGDYLRFGGPRADIATIIESSRTGTPQPSSQPDLTRWLRDAAELVHPLIVLNQSAQRRVLDYVLHHAPTAEAELRLLLEREVLWRLGNDRVRIAPRVMNLYLDVRPDVRAPFKDMVPNGARILSFQGPQRLTRQISSLAEIDRASRDATRLVDCFATAVAQQAHGSDPSSALAMLAEITNNHSLLAISETNTRSLLCYVSQMLLTAFSQFGPNFFPLLESLTYGYAEFVQAHYGPCSPLNYEASRWITNLGYVYDEVAVKQGHYLSASRSIIYKSAATYLSNLQPQEPVAWAEIRYSEAWQLWDSGQQGTAISLFETTARSLEREFSRTAPANLLLKFMAQELSVIAFALAPERLSIGSVKCIEAMLEEYGSHFQLAALRTGLLADKLMEDTPANASVDTVVLASYPDLHISLLVAQALRREFKRTTKVILVPCSGGEKRDLTPCVEGALTLVIGAPDTPGAIGEFISGKDTELVRLYQLRLLSNFGATIKSQNEGNDIYFLSSCGLAGNLYAWHAFIDRHGEAIKLEQSPMDLVLIKELLLVPLATALETRVFNAVVDCLVGKLRGTKKEEASAALQSLHKAKPEQFEKLVGALDEDVKASLAEITSASSLAQALCDATATLHLAHLDLNQMLSIAELAFILASNLREKASPASADEASLNRYVLGFRQQRTEVADLRENYLATSQLDTLKLNDCAEKLLMSLRNFRNTVNRLGGNG